MPCQSSPIYCKTSPHFAVGAIDYFMISNCFTSSPILRM
jgi:hypothetical protein